MPEGPRYHLAYVFERFPTFTQTFCVREVLELERQGIRPLIFSLRDTSDEPAQGYPADLRDRVHVLPPPRELSAHVRQLRCDQQLSKAASLTIGAWDGQPDKYRIYEAAYIGHHIATHAPYIRHAHCHFAGMAARTLWWLRNFYHLTYNVTAHANDVFCPEPDSPVPRADVLADASRIVTVSDYTVDRISREHPAAAPHIQRVYNGLDIAPFAAASDGGKPDGIGTRRITTVGRLIEKKGFDDLVRASAILLDRGVDHTVHIIGDGPLEDDLRAQIAEAGLERTVFLEGPKDQPEIIDILAKRTHLFALPCVTEHDGGMDNLPTVIMEAMAVGLPCVSTRLAGVPEMVAHGESGLLCGERQPEAFADHLQSLLEDDDRCRAFGARGFELAAQNFDKAVTTAHLRSALVSGGLVRFSNSQRALFPAYLQQLPLRLKNALNRPAPHPEIVHG